MKVHKNVLMLQEVAKGLGPLKDEVVFVGGAVTSLYVNDPAAPPVTASDDVDCVVEVTSLGQYAEIESALRRRGFKRPVNEEDLAIICRWDYLGILVDVMPTEEKILGFSNKWYREAIREKVPFKLPDGTTISIFSVPFFMATKLDALKGRGEEDLRVSQDLEDIVSVLDGCLEIQGQLESAPPQLKTYFRKEFSRLLEDPGYLLEAVSGFLRSAGDYSVRSEKVIAMMKGFLER